MRPALRRQHAPASTPRVASSDEPSSVASRTEAPRAPGPSRLPGELSRRAGCARLRPANAGRARTPEHRDRTNRVRGPLPPAPRFRKPGQQEDCPRTGDKADSSAFGSKSIQCEPRRTTARRRGRAPRDTSKRASPSSCRHRCRRRTSRSNRCFARAEHRRHASIPRAGRDNFLLSGSAAMVRSYR